MQEHDKEISVFLLELLSENPDIQTFFNKATEYLGNPLTMVDTRFRIVYASENVTLDIPLWTDSISEHFVSDGIISSMEKNEILDKIRNGKNKAFRSDLPNGYKALRTPLFYRGKCCGFLGMYDYMRPFGEGDESFLTALARALTILYNADPNILGAMDDSRDDYFLELIKCENQEMAQILTRRNRGIQFGQDKMMVCLTRRVQGMSAQNVAFGRLRDFLRQGIYHHVSAIYNHHLVLLFSLNKASSGTRRSILSSLQECCEKYDLHAGISFSFEEDSFIPLAYKQALKASLYAKPEHRHKGAAHKAFARICYYEEYLLRDIMNASLRVYPAALYRHPILAKLAAYDEEYGTKYLETLRLYLHTFCNMKVTSLELGVHYNTIKYRLSMIEEIAGCDIRGDSELLMRLAVSLRILDFESEHDEMKKSGQD